MQFGVHNHSLSNVLRGLVERVFCVEGKEGLCRTPQPKVGVFNQLSGFRARLLRHLGSCRPWSVDRFINSYKGAKQMAVRRAAESVSSQPITKMDAILNTFVKAEKLNLSKKPDPAPRVIQPRSARYNVCVGPYLKSCEHNVYHAIGEVWGGPTVMKGYNAVDTATHMRTMWDSFANPVGIGLDASRFDQHVSKDALAFEHSIYNAMFRDKDLRRWLSWQLKNCGKAFTPDGVVSYFVEGCRMSGDMNTALGNCLLMCALVWVYAQYRKVPCRLANNGDDCMVIMSKTYAETFRLGLREWFMEFGFNMKVEDTVFEFERLEFCQTRPVYVGRWVMVRDFRVCLDKDTCCLHPDSIPYREWLTHVGCGGGALSNGVPILQTFYQRLRELGKPTTRSFDVSGMSMLARGLVCDVTPVSDEARVSFYKAFGVAPWDQISMEEAISSAEVDMTVGVKSDVLHFSTHILNIPDGW